MLSVAWLPRLIIPPLSEPFIAPTARLTAPSLTTDTEISLPFKETVAPLVADTPYPPFATTFKLSSLVTLFSLPLTLIAPSAAKAVPIGKASAKPKAICAAKCFFLLLNIIPPHPHSNY